MNDLNSVSVIGRLTRDCGQQDFSYTQGGMAIAKVSIAVNRSKKQADGSWTDEASFFDVTIFGKTAENLHQYLLKGKQIGIKGYLKQDRWQDKQTGENRSKVYIVAEEVQLLGDPQNNGSRNGGYQQSQQNYQQQNFQQTPPPVQVLQNAGLANQSQFAQQYQQQNYGQQSFPEQIPF